MSCLSRWSSESGSSFHRAMSPPGYVDSDWAGPKSDSSPVRLYARSGKCFTNLKLSYIYC
ncbi:hypothetical protein GCM10010307_14430 [Streptomyces vastus]|uniref:Uncharacterized protein n=1 Tax=Streptomyces vastus TaxID=285451 RepID=A0ABP6CX77_9ACTN